MTYERGSQQLFLGTSALLFVVSAGVTTIWSTSMTSIGEMSMPGGWSMSMTWMRMSGQTWFTSAASFIGMWAVMMIAMMLPSLVPALWRYRRNVNSNVQRRLNGLTAVVAIGYFFVWTVCGVAVFPLGAALARLEMQCLWLARLVPVAVGIVVVIAGALQFTTWKVHHLTCCREPPGITRTMQADTATALRQGLRLGLNCIHSCAGLTAILLVTGVMDIRVMTLVTAAITTERLAPNGKRTARVVGIVVVGIGLLLVTRAAARLR